MLLKRVLVVGLWLGVERWRWVGEAEDGGTILVGGGFEHVVAVLFCRAVI